MGCGLQTSHAMTVVDRVRRSRSLGVAGENLVEALGHVSPAEADGSDLPVAIREGVRSFYDYLRRPGEKRVCTGTACRFAPGFQEPAPSSEATEVRCLGRCYEAPSETTRPSAPIPRRALVAEPIVLRHVLGDRVHDLEATYAVARRGDALAVIAASGLRGRGGAAYATAAKWAAARQASGPEKYVVANGDEGDPGSYVDRLLLEEDPHAVLAGMAVCARIIGATRGIVYVRAEYPVAAERVRAAIDEARPMLPDGFPIEVHVGAGSYVCGEETALLRSLEGLRGEAQPRPPYPAERGLHGHPTVVQNVETLAIVPWVVATGRRPDTKAFSLSGAVASPGVIEAGFGTTLAELLAAGGGCPPGGHWGMALVGGPMGRVVPAERFAEVRLGYDTLPGMGHGGVVVFDDSVSPRALAEHLFAFAASESCGSCAPCRIGTAQLASRRDRAGLERLLDTLEIGSLCGFGQGVPRPVRDLLAWRPDRLFPEVAP
jgi:NADH:ubiquinone oxidoreductase subunit F (NADH-binding)